MGRGVVDSWMEDGGARLAERAMQVRNALDHGLPTTQYMNFFHHNLYRWVSDATDPLIAAPPPR